MPTLSIIIPSYRSKHLGEVVEAAGKLDHLQLFIVDSSPNKPSLEGWDRSIVHLPKKTAPGAARNEGARRARGDYLLFVDADVVFTDHTRAFLRNWLQSENAISVGGVYENDDPQQSAASRFQNVILNFRLFERLGASTPLKSTSHLLIRRADFERVGGFNETMDMYEDVELLTRCHLLGIPISTSSEFSALHRKQFTIWTLLTDYFLKSYSALIFRNRYPRIFRGSGVHLGWQLSLTWLLGATLPFAMIGAYFSPLIGGLSAAAILLAPLMLWPKGLKSASFSDKLRSFYFCPLIANAIAAGAALAMISSLVDFLADKAVRTADWARAAVRVVFRTGMPVQIINYVTARCNLRCDHCFYKETLDAPDPGELSLEMLDRATREIGPVLWYSLTGGEPFIRKDLKDLIAIVQKNCRPKVLSFPTNGWYVERTFRTTLRVLQNLPRSTLILFFSLDGPQEIHDRIRGNGSFDRVRQTMDRLRPLQALYPNLYLNVITTVTADNAHVAPDFVDELVRDFSPNAISINLFRYHSLEHPAIPDAVIEGYRETVDRYARHLRNGVLKHYGFLGGRILMIKEILQKEMIYRIAKNDEFVTPCTAGTLSYVIMEDGRIKPCEILEDSIGSIAEPSAVLSFSQMVKAAPAVDLRQWIRDSKCKCTYECAQTTNTLFSWPMSGHLALGVARSVVGQSS
jgi:MoaA/NifB/PqqE/SkfB family radical SAM enzyme/GT2 family glycosyltransferase